VATKHNPPLAIPAIKPTETAELLDVAPDVFAD